MLRSFFFGFVIFLGTTCAGAANAHAHDYSNELASLRVGDAVHRAARKSGSDTPSSGSHVRRSIERLFDAWEGTPWGLGRPQTDLPHRGKINCGTFVGTVLRHAGFNVNHVKLQRQPSELIIKSLTTSPHIERFRNKPMRNFLAGVREMGPGLYVIGLDYHVGFIAVDDDGPIRFIHAGYYPGKVVDEPAVTAQEIIESRYRVVGKILQPDLMRAWERGARVRVRGDW